MSDACKVEPEPINFVPKWLINNDCPDEIGTWLIAGSIPDPVPPDPVYVFLVRFACMPDDEVKFYILDEKKHDDWCMAEPPQGYKCFETVWHGEIAGVVTKYELPMIE